MNSDLKSFNKIEQQICGSRKISNYIIGGMLTIGGIGFLLGFFIKLHRKRFITSREPFNIIVYTSRNNNGGLWSYS